ncbi:MAG: DNA topoisomerase [Acidobacteria bacterium]|nr:DNA topoisomerase [Acidobacteriota bacterium]
MPFDAEIALPEETRRRYLNYALSVITSRALPDVRDGLKPVQRRILFSMYQNLHLMPDAKFKKSATVVGDVIGKYHPHGDTAIYDALVRMAQPFTLRLPLVEGHGNFGSLDGDAPAAYRYTEARLRTSAVELLSEIKRRTVDWRPNFDGVLFEPVVLSARFPNLLINGASGIAVGMATSIPPHNPLEVLDAAIALVDEPDGDPLRTIRGPDFPTGGALVTSKKELREIYESGQGTLKLRAEYTIEEKGRGAKAIVITSVPYATPKATLVEKIAEVIIERKLPPLLDVRDESTGDVRIVLEIKRDADPGLVMSYLYKHTPLQVTVPVNLTCLVPSAAPAGGSAASPDGETTVPEGQALTEPARLSVAAILRHFLDFRLETVRRRFEFDLLELKRRIHLLEGFEKIFDGLDEAIRIIRHSEGKADAAAKLMKRFDLDAEQADAILETKLYKIARLEIKAIQEELLAKRLEARKIEAILASPQKLWGVVQRELVEVRALFAQEKRKTRITMAAGEPEYNEEAFIQHEDSVVILTADGWLKRQRELKDPKQTRLREGDEVQAALQGSTRELVAFFTNYGSAYVCRINDIPASTGYGEPVQKTFKFGDGEKVIQACSFDPRVTSLEGRLLFTLSRQGFVTRLPVEAFRELTTRNGRRYGKTMEGDEIVHASLVKEGDTAVIVSEQGKTILFPVDEVPVLASPGRGVIGLKLAEGDRVVASGILREGVRDDSLPVETSKGTRINVTRRFAIVSRAGKGFDLVKRDKIVRAIPAPIELVDLSGTSAAD